MAEDLDRIRERIRLLRGRTEAAGCTSAEAEQAALAAMALMAKYQVPEDLADRPPIRNMIYKVGKARLRRPWTDLYHEIFHWTACRGYIRDFDGSLQIEGFEPDVEIAVYILDVTGRILDDERKACLASAAYKRRKLPRTRRTHLADWLAGVVMGLRHKIREAARDLGDGKERARRLDLVDQHSTTQAVTYKPRGRPPTTSSAAFQEGAQRGLKHDIRVGVGTADTPKLIGGA